METALKCSLHSRRWTMDDGLRRHALRVTPSRCYASRKKKRCKPISRILSGPKGPSCHLSGSALASGLYLPTPFDKARSLTGRATRLSRLRPLAEACDNRSVHGISTHEVCPRRRLPVGAVRSYRTFSPLPLPRGAVGGMVSVTLSVRRPSRADAPPVRWRGALRCPDFPRPGTGPVRGRMACNAMFSMCLAAFARTFFQQKTCRQGLRRK